MPTESELIPALGARMLYAWRTTSYLPSSHLLILVTALGAGVFPMSGHASAPRRVDGLPSAVQKAHSNPGGMTRFGDLIYFSATTPETGRELFVTDGTTDGTAMVADLFPGPGDSEPGLPVVAGSQMFFTARDPDHGLALWVIGAPGQLPVRIPGVEKPWSWLSSAGLTPTGRGVLSDEFGDLVLTDGTAEGTRRLPFIARPRSVSYYRWFLPVGDRLLHKVEVDAGVELRVLDLLTAETKTIAGSEVGLTDLGALTAYAGGLIFSGTTPDAGAEPWFSDGTASGTHLISDISLGAQWSAPHAFQARGGRAAFVLGSWAGSTCVDCDDKGELWLTDGTPQGTVPVIDADGGRYGVAAPFPTLSDRILFSHSSGSLTNWWNTRLASLDLATGSTEELDVEPTAWFYGGYERRQEDGRAWFAGTGRSTFGLWSSDGTRAGTVLELSGPSFGQFSIALRFKQLAIFGGGEGLENGLEPWVLSLDTHEASELKNLAQDIGGPGPAVLVGTLGGVAASLRSDGAARQLWFVRADQAPAQLGALTDGGSFVPIAGSPDGVLGECGTESWDRWLCRWRADRVPAIEAVSGGNVTVDRAQVLRDGRVVFATWDGAVMIWSPLSGVLQTLDAQCGWPPRLALTADHVFYACGPGVEWKLMSFDGDAGESVELAPPSLVKGSAFGIVAADRFAVFSASNGAAGREPWVSDGTLGGTSMLVDLRAGPASSNPEAIGATGRHVYFLADGADGGRELWATDGSARGTQMVLDRATTGLEVSVLDGEPSGTYIGLSSGAARAGREKGFAAVGDRAYISLSDVMTGSELWTSDGTMSGTRRVIDLVPGDHGSQPANVTAVGDAGWFAFTAWTPETGLELWRSDGSARNTQLVADLNPGPASSAPDLLTVSGETLYFAATDGTRERQLWAVPLDEEFFEPRFLCGCGAGPGVSLVGSGLAITLWGALRRRHRKRPGGQVGSRKP